MKVGVGGGGEAGGVVSIRMSSIWTAREGVSLGCEVRLSQSLTLSNKIPGRTLNGGCTLWDSWVLRRTGEEAALAPRGGPGAQGWGCGGVGEACVLAHLGKSCRALEGGHKGK